MGDVAAKAYLASPEVVAASALQGEIAGPNWYHKPEGVEKVIIGEGSGDHVADKAMSIGDALDKILNEAESMIAAAEGTGDKSPSPAATQNETTTDVLAGFPEKIEGEIVFCDSDNVNTDGIYPGMLHCLFLLDLLTVEQVNIHIRIIYPRRKWPKCVWRTTIQSFAQLLDLEIFWFRASILELALPGSRLPLLS